MKIKYKGEKYDVYLKDFFIIKIEQYILFIKRIKRLIDRAIKYFESLLITAVMLCIYVILTYYVGRIYNEYHSLKRVIWDSRELIFSTLIIVYAVNFTSKERIRNKKLKHQRWDFLMLIEKSDCLLIEICNFIGIKYTKSIVLSNDLNKKFKEKINEYDFFKGLILRNELKESIQFKIKKLKSVYIKIMNNIKYNRYEIIKKYDIEIFSELLNVCNEFELMINYNCSPDKLKDIIIRLSYDMYLSCLYIGRIWAWDYERSQHIRRLLLKKLNNDHWKYYELKRWF